MRARFVVIVVALGAVAVAAVLSLGGGKSKGGGGEKAPKNALVIRFAYSPERPRC